ncbi:phytanoyl-CoA dioxygenase [Rhodobacteraceae bacterium 2CG4]|uniref:Phytanoyl-CoA dioxygenase n=1 Tax=Halovulum marinum TaxID=2662447 RepID=A0A6L5YXN0_9RHOB|nr:phytanoyl-CoA dioxygenase family protein [Halovulum marinum]MSU88958.1 phytanoyl-CoA dioxygenase [Halovulum marinum]
MTALRRVALFPVHLAQVFTGAKSFVKNPVIGSHWANRHGLHVARVRWADRMAAFRRRLIRPFVDVTADERAQFARDGFVVVHDFLPAELYQRVRAEAFAHEAAPREMRQGLAVTRRVTLDPDDAAALPACVAAAQKTRLKDIVRYVAAHYAQPFCYLQIIIANPERGETDPQTSLHMDTFHPIAKAWLFLHDIAEDEGPFRFVPGSHKATPRRLEWERRQSIAASDAANTYTARGSFRVGPEDLRQMGLPDPVPMAVPGNTLIVADTHAFHGRTPSPRATVRVEIYATLRRAPFVPWTGLDPLLLPGLRGRAARLLDAARDRAADRGLTGHAWRPVSRRRMDSPDIAD